VRERIRGHGCTIYTTPLEEIEIDRSQIELRLARGEFDLVIFGCIARQYELFLYHLKWLTPDNTVILDGADGEDAMPHLRSDPLGRWIGLRPPTVRFPYYKREFTRNTQFNPIAKLACRLGWPWPTSPPKVRPIAFCIPDSKLRKDTPAKDKSFPAHIVDAELRTFLGLTNGDGYTFDSEEAYYGDLASSKFGITTKRGRLGLHAALRDRAQPLGAMFPGS
jgi:hypothetical protein